MRDGDSKDDRPRIDVDMEFHEPHATEVSFKEKLLGKIHNVGLGLGHPHGLDSTQPKSLRKLRQLSWRQPLSTAMYIKRT